MHVLIPYKPKICDWRNSAAIYCKGQLLCNRKGLFVIVSSLGVLSKVWLTFAKYYFLIFRVMFKSALHLWFSGLTSFMCWLFLAFPPQHPSAGNAISVVVFIMWCGQSDLTSSCSATQTKVLELSFVNEASKCCTKNVKLNLITIQIIEMSYLCSLFQCLNSLMLNPRFLYHSGLIYLNMNHF